MSVPIAIALVCLAASALSSGPIKVAQPEVQVSHTCYDGSFQYVESIPVGVALSTNVTTTQGMCDRAVPGC